jgi:hypothetical protein
MSLPDIRVARWRLRLRADDAVLAKACRDPAVTRDLAAATLAPILAALDPGADEILVLDRLDMPPLTLAPDDNAATLRRHVEGVVDVLRSGARRRFADRRAALAAFAMAAARGTAEDLWLWRALGFLSPDEGLAEAPDRAAREIAASGAGALPLLLRLAAAGADAGGGALARLWPRLATPRLVALADAVAPAVPPMPSADGTPTRESVRLALAILRAARPTMLTLAASANPVRSMAAARVALAAAGAAALPAAQFTRLAAAGARHFAVGTARAPDLPSAFGAPLPTRAARPGGPAADAPAGWAARAPAAASGPGALPGSTKPRPVLLDRPLPAAARDVAAVDLSTAHGGLLFLLNLMPETALLALPPAALVRHGLTAPLVRLARALGVPRDDPATRAFAGLWPGRVAGDTDPRRPPTEPPALRAADRSTRRLVEGLLAALARRPATGLTVQGIIRRSGRISFAPAEIDLHLPLSGVHTGIRRAGLDASPGFLPWLGSIVRVHYADS